MHVSKIFIFMQSCLSSHYKKYLFNIIAFTVNNDSLDFTLKALFMITIYDLFSAN